MWFLKSKYLHVINAAIFFFFNEINQFIPNECNLQFRCSFICPCHSIERQLAVCINAPAGHRPRPQKRTVNMNWIYNHIKSMPLIKNKRKMNGQNGQKKERGKMSEWKLRRTRWTIAARQRTSAAVNWQKMKLAHNRTYVWYHLARECKRHSVDWKRQPEWENGKRRGRLLNNMKVKWKIKAKYCEWKPKRFAVCARKGQEFNRHTNAATDDRSKTLWKWWRADTERAERIYLCINESY